MPSKDHSPIAAYRILNAYLNYWWKLIMQFLFFKQIIHDLTQGLPNYSCKGPDGKYSTQLQLLNLPI